jgi:nucleotide-binding universal stress UspA family protein
MYKTILVPLDGSKRAEKILPHVEELAHCHDARVIFLQVVALVLMPVVTAPGAADSMSLSMEDMERNKREAKTYLAGWQGEFREKGIEARTRVEQGPIVETIINVAERESADLIAMASHGHTGLSSVFFGSVATGILHRVDRPLLLVRS